MFNLLHSSRNGLQSIESFVIILMRWAPLQVSAHILQNLLLWWTLSATPRGCAFFCLIFCDGAAAAGSHSCRAQALVQLPLVQCNIRRFYSARRQLLERFEHVRGWATRPRDENTTRFGYTCAGLLLRVFRLSPLVQICGSESIAFFATAFSAAWSPSFLSIDCGQGENACVPLSYRQSGVSTRLLSNTRHKKKAVNEDSRISGERNPA